MRSTAEGTHPGEAAREGLSPKRNFAAGGGSVGRRENISATVTRILVECYFGTILHLVFFGVMRTVGALASAFLF